MALNTYINRDIVENYYNGLVKQYGKNVLFFATPTNEKYRFNNGYSTYDLEYNYKICHNSGNGNITINRSIYTSSSSLSCSYLRQDGVIEVKNGGTSGSIGANELTYTNAKTVVPTLTFERYGGIYTNETFILLFFTIAFVFAYFIIRSIMPRLR